MIIGSIEVHLIKYANTQLASPYNFIQIAQTWNEWMNEWPILIDTWLFYTESKKQWGLSTKIDEAKKL